MAVNPMPIWLHLVLRIACSAVGLFAGAILGWLVAILLLMTLDALGVKGVALAIMTFVLMVPFLLMGGYLGSIGGMFAIDRFPARCPRCRQLSSVTRTDYRFRHGTPVVYYCRACGHVHKSWLREGAGRLG
jgi:hypothetical protein